MKAKLVTENVLICNVLKGQSLVSLPVYAKRRVAATGLFSSIVLVSFIWSAIWFFLLFLTSGILKLTLASISMSLQAQIDCVTVQLK